MAVLPDADRITVWAGWMRELSNNRTPMSLTKDQLRAVIDAIDDWVDANAVSLNQAIPQPQRGILTARQKAQLLVYVVTRRFEVS